MVAAVCSTISWSLVWPFEVLKNLAQAQTKGMGETMRERAKYIYRTQGVKGFFRGLLPGANSVFWRSGCSMIVMQYGQKQLTQMGLRD